MNRLINYIIEKQSTVELYLEIHYSNNLKWTIYIFKKGYDSPIVRVRENDKDEAFDLAYTTLKLKLEGHI